MGRDSRQMTVFATVSRHNSERDVEDDALWEEMIEKIMAIVDEYSESSIGAWH